MEELTSDRKEHKQESAMDHKGLGEAREKLYSGESGRT